jgi:YspA, cpYpsA-related SLOG family
VKILCCGSRDWTNVSAVMRELGRLPQGTVVIHGAARGADEMAAAIAKRSFKFEVESYPAVWMEHGELDGKACGCDPNKVDYCRQAGFRRNQQMIDEGKPDRVIAFQKNKSGGTADMIRRAKKAGLPVKVITDDYNKTA